MDDMEEDMREHVDNEVKHALQVYIEAENDDEDSNEFDNEVLSDELDDASEDDVADIDEEQDDQVAKKDPWWGRRRRRRRASTRQYSVGFCGRNKAKCINAGFCNLVEMAMGDEAMKRKKDAKAFWAGPGRRRRFFRAIGRGFKKAGKWVHRKVIKPVLGYTIGFCKKQPCACVAAGKKAVALAAFALGDEAEKLAIGSDKHPIGSDQKVNNPNKKVNEKKEKR